MTTEPLPGINFFGRSDLPKDESNIPSQLLKDDSREHAVGVWLGTMHRAKDLEFKARIIVVT